MLKPSNIENMMLFRHIDAVNPELGKLTVKKKQSVLIVGMI